MKKVLFLIIMLFFTACATQESITTEKIKVYNVYGQRFIEIKTHCDLNNLNSGVYFIQIIENDTDAPYWTKVVQLNLK